MSGEITWHIRGTALGSAPGLAPWSALGLCLRSWTGWRVGCRVPACSFWVWAPVVALACCRVAVVGVPVMVSGPRRGGIIISYRRVETAGQAGRLYDRLSGRFGPDQVFMDVDSIAFGIDFTQAITEAVSQCAIMLVLIGREWSAVTDGRGRRRIDDPDDFVRVEIEAALARDIRVVPVLVEGAVLPQASDLPSGLRPLIRRQALLLSHAGFGAEVSRL